MARWLLRILNCCLAQFRQSNFQSELYQRGFSVVVMNSLFTLDMPFLKFVHVSSEGDERSSMTGILDQFSFRHEKIQTSLFGSVFYTLKFESGKT